MVPISVMIQMLSLLLPFVHGQTYQHPLGTTTELSTSSARIWKYNPQNIENDLDYSTMSFPSAGSDDVQDDVNENNKDEIQTLLHDTTSSNLQQPSFLPVTLSSSPLPNTIDYSNTPFLSRTTITTATTSSSNTKKYRKTGTTIVGCTCQTKNTIIIAADTRATEGSVVADKTCEKVHTLARNVWACGAGTSGDLDALVKKVRYTFLFRGVVEGSVGNGPLELNDGCDDDYNYNEKVVSSRGGSSSSYITEEELSIGMRLPIASIPAITRFIQKELYEGKGEIGANLVLGGYDPTTNRAVLTAIHPHGSMDVVPYTALGSGGLAAMGVLESRYRTDLSLEETIDLVKDAVHAGIKNDLGSGSQIDICIIHPNDDVEYIRGYVKEEELVILKEDVEMEEEVHKRHISKHDEEEEDIIMSGVNGFGSLPYSVNSRRVLIENEERIEKVRNEWLDDILNGE